MFSTAKVVPAKKPTTKKAAAEALKVEGLEGYAAVCAAIKALEARKEIFESKVKGTMAEIFVENGIAKGKKPENLKAVEGAAEGSLQLRLRSSASKLSEEEVELLADNDIPYETVTVVEDTFIINPEYATDMKLLGKIEEALKKVKGIPADFIMKQEGVAKNIVTEDSLDAIFKTNERTAAALLPLVSCMAIRSKVNGDFMPIIDRIMEEEEA